MQSAYELMNLLASPFYIQSISKFNREFRSEYVNNHFIDCEYENKMFLKYLLIGTKNRNAIINWN